jgi:hypothetical protein
MTKIRIAALVAALTMAIPVFAQDSYNQTSTTTTTTIQTSPNMNQDTAKAYRQAEDLLNDPNIHWTVKNQAALLVQSPYVRPSDMWELSHMFRTMAVNDQRVIYSGLTNAIRANAGDYYARRSAERNYWLTKYNSMGTVTTTVTTTAPPVAVVTTPPAITTPSTSYTPSTVVETTTVTTRPQSMVGSITGGMGVVAAWELIQKDMDAADRTTFRTLWDDMTSSQQDALINIVRNSHYYFVTRSAGVYYNPF